MKILIDAGHGGADPGAIGYGLKESQLNLRDSLLLKSMLEDGQGKNVIDLTRYHDETLDRPKRKRLIQAKDYDFFVCIHHNGGGGEGFESYISRNPSSFEIGLQELIHTAVIPILKGYKVPDRGPKRLNFWTLLAKNCPGIYLENGFVNDQEDMEFATHPVRKALFYHAIAQVIKNAFVY